jgi:hypothetical protein
MGATDPDIERMDAQIKEWGEKIESLVIGAETAAEHVRADLRRHARDLRIQWIDAEARLQDFKAAGSETWDAFRTGIECVWRDLEVALQGIPQRDPGPKSSKRDAIPRTAPSRLDFRSTTPTQPIRHRAKKR